MSPSNANVPYGPMSLILLCIMVYFRSAAINFVTMVMATGNSPFAFAKACGIWPSDILFVILSFAGPRIAIDLWNWIHVDPRSRNTLSTSPLGASQPVFPSPWSPSWFEIIQSVFYAVTVRECLPSMVDLCLSATVNEWVRNIVGVVTLITSLAPSLIRNGLTGVISAIYLQEAEAVPVVDLSDNTLCQTPSPPKKKLWIFVSRDSPSTPSRRHVLRPTAHSADMSPLRDDTTAFSCVTDEDSDGPNEMEFNAEGSFFSADIEHEEFVEDQLVLEQEVLLDLQPEENITGERDYEDSLDICDDALMLEEGLIAAGNIEDAVVALVPAGPLVVLDSEQDISMPSLEIGDTAFVAEGALLVDDNFEDFIAALIPAAPSSTVDYEQDISMPSLDIGEAAFITTEALLMDDNFEDFAAALIGAGTFNILDDLDTPTRGPKIVNDEAHIFIEQPVPSSAVVAPTTAPIFSAKSIRRPEIAARHLPDEGRICCADWSAEVSREEQFDQIDRVIAGDEGFGNDLHDLGKGIRAVMKELGGQMPDTPPKVHSIPNLDLIEASPPANKNAEAGPSRSANTFPEFLEFAEPIILSGSANGSFDEDANTSLAWLRPQARKYESLLSTPLTMSEPPDTSDEWKGGPWLDELRAQRKLEDARAAAWEDSHPSSLKGDDGGVKDRSLDDFDDSLMSEVEEKCTPGAELMKSLGLQYEVEPSQEPSTPVKQAALVAMQQLEDSSLLPTTYRNRSRTREEYGMEVFSLWGTPPRGWTSSLRHPNGPPARSAISTAITLTPVDVPSTFVAHSTLSPIGPPPSMPLPPVPVKVQHTFSNDIGPPPSCPLPPLPAPTPGLKPKPVMQLGSVKPRGGRKSAPAVTVSVVPVPAVSSSRHVSAPPAPPVPVITKTRVHRAPVAGPSKPAGKKGEFLHPKDALKVKVLPVPVPKRVPLAAVVTNLPAPPKQAPASNLAPAVPGSSKLPSATHLKRPSLSIPAPAVHTKRASLSGVPKRNAVKMAVLSSSVQPPLGSKGNEVGAPVRRKSERLAILSSATQPPLGSKGNEVGGSNGSGFVSRLFGPPMVKRAYASGGR